MIALLLKMTAVAAAGLLTAQALRRCRASIRHAVLLATVAAIALLPLTMAALPQVTIEVPVPLGSPVSSGTATPADASPAQQSATPRAQTAAERVTAIEQYVSAVGTTAGLNRTLAVIWTLGASASAMMLLLGVLRVQRLQRTGIPAPELQAVAESLAARGRVRRSAHTLLHEELAAPITCGITRPVIVMPREATEWTTEALERAIVHELEHVRRRDWPVQLFAHAVQAFYWFHPLVRVATRQLCVAAEQACDDAVLARYEGATYADQLVTLARHLAARPRLGVLGMAERSDLAARVHALLDASRARGRAGVLRSFAIGAAAALLVAAIAPLHVTAAITPTELSASSVQGGSGVRARDRALVEASDAGDVESVRELLADGADVNARVAGDGTPLIAAAREGHHELVALLLDRGADPNLPVPGDGAPLIMAAREGHLRVVQLLLDRGATIDLIVPGDENALIQASLERHLDVVKLLVSRGADVNARAWAESRDPRRRGEWRTPLGMALRGGHRDLAAFLVRAGARQEP
jgi:bla regulator protein blaR1